MSKPLTDKKVMKILRDLYFQKIYFNSAKASGIILAELTRLRDRVKELEGENTELRAEVTSWQNESTRRIHHD